MFLNSRWIRGLLLELPEWIVSWHLFFLLLCFQQLPPPSTKRLAAPVIVHQSAVESRPHSPFSWQYQSLIRHGTHWYSRIHAYHSEFKQFASEKVRPRVFVSSTIEGNAILFLLFVLVLIKLYSWGTSFLGLSPIVVLVKMILVHRNETPGNLWSLFQCQSAVASPLHECFIRGFLCILILGLVSPSKSETQLCMCMYCVLYDTQEAKCQDNTTGDKGPHALWSSRWPWACVCISPNSRSSVESDPLPPSCLFQTLIDQKPPADMKLGSWHACLKGSLSTSQTMINQYTRTLPWDRFVPLWVVRFTISILFWITIAPNSVHCSSSVLSLCSPRAADIYAFMMSSIGWCLWICKWLCDLVRCHLFAAEIFYQTPWSDCWDCGLKAGIFQKCNVNI